MLYVCSVCRWIFCAAATWIKILGAGADGPTPMAHYMTCMVIRLIFCIMNDNKEMVVGHTEPRLTIAQAHQLRADKRYAVFLYQITAHFWPHFESGHHCADSCSFYRSTFSHGKFRVIENNLIRCVL